MYGATLVGKNSYYNYHRVSKDRAALPCTVYSSACVAGALYILYDLQGSLCLLRRLRGQDSAWHGAVAGKQIFVILVKDTCSCSCHRRRIKTEENAKVFASVWGEEFMPFLAALAALHWMI